MAAGLPQRDRGQAAWITPLALLVDAFLEIVSEVLLLMRKKERDCACGRFVFLHDVLGATVLRWIGGGVWI